MPRCKGKTKSNRRCKLSAMISDGVYCHIHDEIYRNYTNKYCEYDLHGLVEPEHSLNYVDECIPFKKDCEYDFTQLIYTINNPKFMLDSKLNTELFLLQFEEFISLNGEDDENSDTKFRNSMKLFDTILIINTYY